MHNFTLPRRVEKAITLWPVKGDRIVYAEKLLRIVLLLYGCQSRQVFRAVPRLCAFITVGVIGIHSEATVATRLSEFVSCRSQERVDGLVKTCVCVEPLKIPTQPVNFALLPREMVRRGGIKGSCQPT